LPATVGGGEGTRLRRVLLRWQAPQPCRSRPGRPWPGRLDPYVIPYVNPYVIPYAQGWRTPASVVERICPAQSPSWGQSAAKTAADWPPYGGVERPGRKVRFARSIHRPVRVLGVPSARAACGGSLKPDLVTTYRSSRFRATARAVQPSELLGSGRACHRSGQAL
jgi:hypothetical protein